MEAACSTSVPLHPPTSFRRTRIVCISDTHNHTPALPAGDVLVHAGDLTNQGTVGELSRQVRWLEGLHRIHNEEHESRYVPKSAPAITSIRLKDEGGRIGQSRVSNKQRRNQNAGYEAIIVIAGNHDIALDEKMYGENASRVSNRNPQDLDAARRLFGLEMGKRTSHGEFPPEVPRKINGITYLCHQTSYIKLQSLDGPRTKFSIFGSPYSPAHGDWAFGYDQSQTGLWDSVPEGVDILLTHTPPRAFCDRVDSGDLRQGCSRLFEAVRRAQPRLHVCGHLHQGRGSAVLSWNGCDLVGSMTWADPGAGNGKLSLVDLTGRKAREAWSHSTGAPDWTPRQHTGNPAASATCVVNAAIKASNYGAPKRFNKPIVVDIDLPVCEEAMTEGSAS